MTEQTKTGADGNKAQGAQPTSQANSAESLDSQVAEGLPEGEVRALRADAGLDQSAGHEANVHAWEQSPAGQAFLAEEGDRQKAIKEEGKTLQALTNDDNLDEGAAKYVEAVRGNVKSETADEQKQAEKKVEQQKQQGDKK